jgi:tetratricopeptide (TPR) repeat protein
MSFDAPHPQLLRGLQLKELGRYADAESAFKEALSQEPNDAFALHQLAGCQWQIPGRHKDALETINQAISVEPNEAEHHVLRAFILCVLDRPKEALAAVRTALEIDPNDTGAFAAEAQAHLQMQNWPKAEEAARQSLALDADNSVAANQLAQALRLQNKQAETDAHLAGMLARDPDDAFTHANAGWSALQRGERLVAETHFREALRIDPDFDYAREGLLTSFRARSPLFRVYLKYCFAMQRLSSGARWAVILGLYFGSRVASALPGGVAIVALYFLFVLWVWVARPVGNFLLLFDAFAKYALRPREKLEAAVVGGALVVGIAGIIASLFFDLPDTRLAGIGLVAASFPFSLTFTNVSPAGRWIFGSLGTAALLAALLVLMSDWLTMVPPIAVVRIWGGACISCLASTWLGNIPALNKRG